MPENHIWCQQIIAAILAYLHLCHTKINVQQGCIGSLYQDLLAGTSEGLMHKVHTICHQGAQSLSKTL